MAFTVSVAPTLAVGSSVKAYPATGWLPGDLPPAPGSAPKGSAADTQTVAAAGTWTSSSLSEDTEYYLTVDGTAYVRVRPDQTAAGLNVTSLPSLPAGTSNIGDVDVVTLPDANPTRPATPTISQVASSAISVTVLASNASARLRAVFNDSTAVLYLKFGSGAASTSSYTAQVGPSEYYEFPQPVYTGAVTGIWASANGNAYVTEVV